MRIIFLNTWYAQVGEPFWGFIQEHSPNTDIFCLQEVTPLTFQRLQALLKNHAGILSSVSWVKNFKVDLGQAIFTKKNLKVVSSGEVSLYKQLSNDFGLLQWVEIFSIGRRFFVGNVHGKTLPGSKLDTPTRLKQSKRIIDFFDRKGSRIIGGDFNLMPQTESIETFEISGYRNLVKGFGVKNTRNRLSWERFRNIQYFSDYVFTSQEVTVKDFSAPDIEISDHLPLILDFEV